MENGARDPAKTICGQHACRPGPSVPSRKQVDKVPRTEIHSAASSWIPAPDQVEGDTYAGMTM